MAKDLPARDRLQPRLEKAAGRGLPRGVGRVYPLELGPPVGWPVQYRVTGPDVETVRDIAFRVAQVMAADAGARGANFDWMEPARQLRVRVDQDQARILGLSSAGLSAFLNATMTGTTVTQLRDDIYLVNVVARATADQRLSLDTLRALQVPLPGGRTVALGTFASFELRTGIPADLAARPRADPDGARRRGAGRAAGSRGRAARRRHRRLTAGLPKGYRIELGGIAEESAALARLGRSRSCR